MTAPQIGVLVPVRLETRFVGPGRPPRWRLRVRVVPDAVSITTHADLPSALELDAVEAMWRDAGDERLETPVGRRAWRTLAAAVGAEVMGPRAGVGRALMAEVRWYYEEGRLGTWELGAPTTHVRDVAGVESEGFAAIARRYAARPDAERAAGNLARALWDFARIGLTPAPRLDRFVREQRQPVPPEPGLSARSQVWAREHRVERPRPVANPVDPGACAGRG